MCVYYMYDVCCRYGRDIQHLVKSVWWVREEKKEDTKESEDSKDSQTVAGDDGDASKEKVNRKGEKMSATDETATCSSDVAFIINPLHNDPIILSAADTTDSIKSLPSPAGEEATST